MFSGFYSVFFNLEEWAAATQLGYKDEIAGGPEISPLNEIPRGAVRTFYLLAIMNATSTLGRVSSAYLCDRFGALNVHAIGTFAASLLVLLLWTMAKTAPAAFAFVVLFGIFLGAVIGLPPASIACILGPDPAAQSRLGQETGQMYSTAATFALTGPVIAGHLISRYGGNYLTVQCWSGVCLFLSASCMAMAIFSNRRMKAADHHIQRNASVSGISTTHVMRSRNGSDKEEL
jgi:MFS family permease